MTTTETKEHYIIAAMLGIGAVVVLVYLYRGGSSSSSGLVAGAATPLPSPSSSNTGQSPIQLGNISIGGSPSIVTTGTPGDGCQCDASASQFVATPKIPSTVLQRGYATLAAYQAASPPSGGGISFSEA